MVGLRVPRSATDTVFHETRFRSEQGSPSGAKLSWRYACESLSTETRKGLLETLCQLQTTEHYCTFGDNNMKELRNDLRTKRTIKSIRYAFSQLVLEKPYSKISITELAEYAEINRKTFYLHYSSLDDLVNEFAEEIVANFIDYVSEEIRDRDLAGCFSKFYHFLSESDEVTRRLMCDDDYTFFYKTATSKLFSSGSFDFIFEGKKNPEIIKAYLGVATSMYRRWYRSGQKIPLEELITCASDLFLNGYSHADV